MNVFTLAVLSCLVSMSTTGCVVYEERHHDTPIVESGPSAPVDSPSAAPSNVAPMLVEIETDQTMNAEGGEGVGVFVEYAKGGHWHIWWSCDTKQTAHSCDFSVSATAATGAISNLDTSELRGGVATATTASRVDVTSSTTTELRGVRFDTDAGATITLEAAIGSLKDGSFLFFVQDGQVNGGFSGQVTNPVQFRGTTP